MIEQALDALKKLDWGQDLAPLQAIDEAIRASHGNAGAREGLEKQLAELLALPLGRDAKDYLCRKLMQIGSAASVPTLAAMLASEEDAHMARYALERIPGAAAADALRHAVSNTTGKLKVGALSSLGARGDEASIPNIAAALEDADVVVARGAALALGAIRTAGAAKALATAKPAEGAKSAVVDASLACAESLLAQGKRSDAEAIYKGLLSPTHPKHVRLAATQGILACKAKKG